MRPVSWPSIWWTCRLPWKASVCTRTVNAVLQEYPLGQVVASVIQTLYVFTDCFDYLFYQLLSREQPNHSQPRLWNWSLFLAFCLLPHKVFPFANVVYLFHFITLKVPIFKSYLQNRYWDTDIENTYAETQDGKSGRDELEIGMDIHAMLFQTGLYILKK